MSEKKVLIITYYWPPSGGSGVQRWLKFVKYLPQFGWTPYVFTPENPSLTIQDESLLADVPPEAEVIKFPIWEPYKSFSKLSGIFSKGKLESNQTGFVSVKRQSLFQQISTWIRGNVFIPDPRVFWVRPSARFLHDFIIDNKITTVITTGPPHSIHLIGYRLKKRNSSIKWLADFRDPWSEWGFLDSLRVGVMAKSIHRRLEKRVLTTADEVIAITPFYVQQFERLSGRKVKLLTNGFDEDDFKDFRVTKSDKFFIRHIGIVNEKCNPRPFMTAVRELCEENEEIKRSIIIEFVGEVHPSFKEFVTTDEALSSITKFTSTVPHQELMNIYSTSSVLLLILTGYKDAEGYMPGKLFEYLATGIPILGVGPTDGDAAVLLNEIQFGCMIDGSDLEGIRNYIKKCFEEWRSDKPDHRIVSASKYSRKELTSELINLLK
jgi:glycosyltransferase involved in cell wall biosynthesis